MQKLSLNGRWTLKYKDETLSASVPGTLYNDLLVAEKMPDPFWRDNEDLVRPITDAGAVYERTFEYTCAKGLIFATTGNQPNKIYISLTPTYANCPL